MSLFGETSTNAQQEEDRLGGGFTRLPSNVYDAEITAAFMGASTSGAKYLTWHFKLPDGQEHKETIYVSTSAAKGCKNYYTKDGQDFNLPGFNIAEAICLLGIQRSISSLTPADIEKKFVKLWNSSEKKEVATEVDMIMPLIGAKVKLGILHKKEDKNAKNAQGAYVPDGSMREFNEINKIFHADSGRTVEECRKQLPTAEFMPKWLDKWKDQIDDSKFKGVRDPSLGAAPAGGANAQGTTNEPSGAGTSSLFS